MARRGRSYLNRQDARARTKPAPVGGWDAKSSLADMPEENAVILDNWFPDRDRVELRPGSTEYATYLGEFSAEFSTEFTVAPGPETSSLMEYIPPSGTARLFAGAGTAIWDTTGGGVSSQEKDGFTNSIFVHAQFNNGSGHYLFAANGNDTLQIYNGTAWADSTITGVTLADVAWVASHQNRVWLGEKNSLTAYYLATAAIAGAATSFSIASYVRRGGYIMGMATWTRDGGDGTDDIAVFITSEGEAVLYQGTDPSSASTWALIGTFYIGRPVNRRAFIKAGADLIVITEGGIVPLSQVLTLDASQAAYAALSDQINQAFADAVRDATGLTDYWGVILYPRRNMMIVNVPVTNDDNVQFAFNTLTGAPCRFTGMNANCWALFNGLAYYGGVGEVVQFDDGFSDQGQPIVGYAVQAFSYFDSPGSEKRFSRVEPVLFARNDPLPSIDIMTDFVISTPSALRGPAPSVTGQWDVSQWDVAAWDATAEGRWGYWEAVQAHGRSAAISMRVNSLDAQPAWVATNWLITGGGPL